MIAIGGSEISLKQELFILAASLILCILPLVVAGWLAGCVVRRASRPAAGRRPPTTTTSRQARMRSRQDACIIIPLRWQRGAKTTGGGGDAQQPHRPSHAVVARRSQHMALDQPRARRGPPESPALILRAAVRSYIFCFENPPSTAQR